MRTSFAFFLIFLCNSLISQNLPIKTVISQIEKELKGLNTHDVKYYEILKKYLMLILSLLKSF